MHNRATRCTLAALVAVCMLTACTAKRLQNALQEQSTWKVSLPAGSQPEGIAAGAENDLWVACLSGNIIHVDLGTNKSTVIHKERNVHLSGAKFDKKQQLLFVAGTLSGKAYLYHMQHTMGATGLQYSVSKREVLDLNTPGRSYINDVALSQDRAYFTDSFNPVLYWVPRYNTDADAVGAGSQQRFGIKIGSGNAAAAASVARPVGRVSTGSFFDTKAGQFRANGIATYKTNEHKDTLLVANTHTGHLYKVVVEKDAPSGDEAPAEHTPVAVAGNIAATKPPPGVGQLSKATIAVASRLRLGRLDNGSKAKGNKQTGNQKAKKAAAVASSTSGNVADAGQDMFSVAGMQEPPQISTAAALTSESDGQAPAAAGDKAAGPGKWSKLAADVAVELRHAVNHQAAPKPGNKLKGAAAAGVAASSSTSGKKAAATPGQAKQGAGIMGRLRNVASHMRLAGSPQDDALSAGNSTDLADASISAVGTGLQAASRPQALSFTARPSAEGIKKLGLVPGTNATRQKFNGTLAYDAHNSSSGSWQLDMLMAAPVKISETRPDVNPAASAAAAAAAAVAVTAAHHVRALGRTLLALQAADGKKATWPGTQMARGIAGRLGLAGRQKRPAAMVQELALPAIAGQYTQRLLVDGIAIKDDMAYVADNYNNRVWGVRLDKGLPDVHVSCGLQGPVMHVPTTLAFQAGRLWWVNAHLDTCFPFLPCPGHTFELHGVQPSLCQPWPWDS